MTEKEFQEEMTWFTEFYEKSLNKIQARMWYDLFKNFPVDDFHNGLIDHLKNSKIDRFPALGEVRERCLCKVLLRDEATHERLKRNEIFSEDARKIFIESLPESIRLKTMTLCFGKEKIQP